MHIDELLAERDAPIVERRPLASGFNPWEIVRYDPTETAKARYQRELEQHGVEIKCETCERVFKVHPMNARTAHACSQACRDIAYRKRKKEGATRPLVPRPWKPWEHRRKS